MNYSPTIISIIENIIFISYILVVMIIATNNDENIKDEIE